MKAESNKLESGDLEIKLTFDEHDQLCLEHDLLDIVDWYVKGPSQQKIINCRERMIQQYKDELMKDPSMNNMTMADVNKLMSDPVQIVKSIANLPQYKNRAERDRIALVP